MGNETVILAVVATLAVVVVILGASVAVRSFLRDRSRDRAQQQELTRESIRVIGEVAAVLSSNMAAMNSLAMALTSAIEEGNERLLHAIEASSLVVSSSLNPESQKRFQESADRLSSAITKHASDIELFGDSGKLMAVSCRKMNDNITALRGIVYGGRRPDDYSVTTDDNESIRRAEMESDVASLMQDHSMSREEATVRVKNLYSTRTIGSSSL